MGYLYNILCSRNACPGSLAHLISRRVYVYALTPRAHSPGTHTKVLWWFYIYICSTDACSISIRTVACQSRVICDETECARRCCCKTVYKIERVKHYWSHRENVSSLRSLCFNFFHRIFYFFNFQLSIIKMYSCRRMIITFEEVIKNRNMRNNGWLMIPYYYYFTENLFHRVNGILSKMFCNLIEGRAGCRGVGARGKEKSGGPSN